MIQIDVYTYPESVFLGTRFAPQTKGNHNLINNQVEEVRKLNSKEEKDVYFKTTTV